MVEVAGGKPTTVRGTCLAVVEGIVLAILVAVLLAHCMDMGGCGQWV